MMLTRWQEYSNCREMCQWFVTLFHNMLDISGINASILWLLKNPEWKNKQLCWHLFLLILGDYHILHSYIIQRAASCCLKKSICVAVEAVEVHPKSQNDTQTIHKNGLCHLCPRTTDRKADLWCGSCQLWACKKYFSRDALLQCFMCSEDCNSYIYRRTCARARTHTQNWKSVWLLYK
jgi:hypothetical protein